MRLYDSPFILLPSMAILLLFLLATLTATAQVDPALPCPTDTLTPRPPHCWEGLTFIFLANPYVQRSYPVYRRRDTKERVSYNEGVGRIATVHNVSYTSPYWKMELVLPDSTVWYVEKEGTMEDGPQLDGLAWYGDLEYARAHLLDRMIWGLVMIPDRNPKEDDDLSQIELGGPTRTLGYGMNYRYVRRYQPLCIVDIQPGEYGSAPVRLVLQEMDGDTVYYHIGISGTNAEHDKAASPKDLHFEDKRLVNGWPDEIWRNIEAGYIEPGMTPEQVRLSWGKPGVVEPNGSSETWYYQPGDRLLFEKGLLVEIDMKSEDLAMPPEMMDPE